MKPCEEDTEFNMYENRNYVIFNVSELDAIDFSQVLETSADTVRRSVDGVKTFVKWEGSVPECVANLQTKGDYLAHTEMLDVLSTTEWAPPEDPLA